MDRPLDGKRDPPRRRRSRDAGDRPPELRLRAFRDPGRARPGLSRPGGGGRRTRLSPGPDSHDRPAVHRRPRPAGASGAHGTILGLRPADLSGRAPPLSPRSPCMSWLAAWYPWIKAAHIVSVMAWMAGMLYLPRLFV